MTTVDNEAKVSAKTDTFVIDHDVHEGVKSLDDLIPYLPPVWQTAMSRWEDRPSSLQAYFAPLQHGSKRAEWASDDMFVETNLESMQKHLFEEEGVSIAILCGLRFFSAAKGSFEYHAALASAYNDWQIENWLEKDDRLRGSIHIVADDPIAATREIDRVAEHPQIVQVFLPAVNDRQYGDPRYDPIYEAASRNRLALAWHHGAHTETALGYPRYWAEWKTTAPPVTMLTQLTSMIFNGTFDKFPDLKLAILESGVGWVPWIMRRMDQQYRECRAEIPWVKRLPSEHMRDNVRIATQPLSDLSGRQFANLVDSIDGDELFIFSTDYPHYDADSVEVLNSPAISDDLRRRISHQNAIEFFPRLNGLIIP